MVPKQPDAVCCGNDTHNGFEGMVRSGSEKLSEKGNRNSSHPDIDPIYSLCHSLSESMCSTDVDCASDPSPQKVRKTAMSIYRNRKILTSVSRIGSNYFGEAKYNSIVEKIKYRLLDVAMSAFEQHTAKRKFSYRTFGEIVLDMAFYGKGKWLVH